MFFDYIAIGSGVAGLSSIENIITFIIKNKKKFIKNNKNISLALIDKEPKNIPGGLVANIKLRIKPNGRIIKSELIKSSGNIRFDNSALQAVRRVEVFHFFDSISPRLYEKEFKNIAISFNPL